jgi:hypothetical protein
VGGAVPRGEGRLDRARLQCVDRPRRPRRWPSGW